MGNQLKNDIRAYMREHPGVKYTEARNKVLARAEQPLLGGVMSDMLSRITGAGTPTPDLESAMQSLGFEFPPEAAATSPIPAYEARQGDVVKIGDRYGLLLTGGTVLLDGKLVDISDAESGTVAFYHLSRVGEGPHAAWTDLPERFRVAFLKAKDEARKVLPADPHATVTWVDEDIPLWGIQPGDILRHGDTASAYIGNGYVIVESGDTVSVSEEVRGGVAVFRPKFVPETPSVGDTLMGVIGGGGILAQWESTEFSAHLHVPLGTTHDNPRVFGIDLGQASHGGTGPHGVIAGKTGTGKSVLTHNMFLALAARNSPDRVGFVFASFNSGFLPAPLESLPHMRATFKDMGTTAEGGAGFVEFVREEMSRREHLLTSYDARDTREYSELRESGNDMPPMPTLLVVVECDGSDLADSLSVRGAMELIGAKGRALGVHLLLVVQHLDSVRMGRLHPNLTYAVAFAAQTAMHSRAVLDGGIDAASLPVGHGDAIVKHHVQGELILDRIRTFRPTDTASTTRLVERISAAGEEWKNRSPV